jgi:coenzyme F420-0:L-glutamate ligase/coenzyme F420-1:gamma-L-glutamate ligase
MKSAFTVYPVVGIPEIEPGDDLAEIILASLNGDLVLQANDILVVTSKIISKAEGQVISGTTRDEAIESETVRVLAERGGIKIVETKHGFIMAAAGIDASNVPLGKILKLPVDSDASARKLKENLQASISPIGIIITDTMGRAWRMGLTDNAIGVAGVMPLLDYRGQKDSSGRILEQTVTAVADEIASAAELAKGKTDRIPVVLVRGLAQYVTQDDGPGSSILIRPRSEDLFSLGTELSEAKGYERGLHDGLNRL